ncbi:MAG: hypothetical protein Tsb009_00090 [Planctomycetaceae bacterium]
MNSDSRDAHPENLDSPLPENAERSALESREASHETQAKMQQIGRSSNWGFLAAIVAGGLLAFGIVSFIPENWRWNLGDSSGKSPSANTDGNPQQGNSGQKNFSKFTSPPKPGSLLSKPTEKSVARKPSTPKTPEGREAAKLLEEAKSLLAKKKTDEANDILERILNEYSETAAATEAEKLYANQ